MRIVNKKLFALVTSLFFIFFSAIAMNKVTAESKPTVMYVYSHHCRMCTVFESKVMSDADVQAELSKFNYKKVDVRHANVYVEGTPTVIIYNRKHEQVRKMTPPPLNKSKFISELRKYE